MDDSTPLGVVLICISGVGVVCNGLAIWGIFALGKLKSTYRPTYIIFLQPLFTDIIFLLTFGCYLAPSVIQHESIFPASISRYASYILDSSQSYCFFNNSLSHVSLAMNRFVYTVLLRMTFFTSARTTRIAIGQHFLALAICISAQFLSPCCRLEINYFGFNLRTVFIDGVPNYSFTYIRLPARIACSVIPFVIYCVILLTTRSISKNMHLKSNEIKKRRKQEQRFTIQFASIAAFYTLSWGLFSILPLFQFSAHLSWLDGASIIFALVNATSNSVAFLLNDMKSLRTYCLKYSSPRSGSVSYHSY